MLTQLELFPDIGIKDNDNERLYVIGNGFMHAADSVNGNAPFF